MTKKQFADGLVPVLLANFPSFRNHIEKGGVHWYREQYAAHCADMDLAEACEIVRSWSRNRTAVAPWDLMAELVREVDRRKSEEGPVRFCRVCGCDECSPKCGREEYVGG